MRAKKKLIISMLAIIFVLLAVVATVAITFALTQQTIKTTLNISYTVEDIDGKASATYTVGGVTNPLTAMKGDTVLGNELVFTAADTEDAGNLEFPEDGLALSSTNDNVVIQYTYTNTGDKHFIASMSFDSNIDYDNMKVEYGIWDFDSSSIKYSEQRYALVVPSEESLSYWIRISIDNKAKSASFTGDFKWLLAGCDKDALAYESLTSLEFTGSAGSYSAAVSTDSTGNYIGEVIFPSEVNGDPVTTISASALGNEQKAQVTSVYIPDSVETIGTSAFENFTNLETVTFEQNETAGASAQSGTGLKTIGDCAFMWCSNLKEFITPNTVTTFGGNAFSFCSGLEKIYIPDSVTNLNWAFFDLRNLKEIIVDKNSSTYIFEGNCLVNKTSGLLILGCNAKNIQIPSCVTTMAWAVFTGCSEIEEITIPGTVKSSQGEMFGECKNLKKVTIEEGFTSFGGADFAQCTSLEEMVIPSTVNNLDPSMYVCMPTKKLTVRCNTNDFFPMSLGTLENLILDGQDMTIGEMSFANCTIDNIFVGNGVKTIVEGAFYNATVQNVTFEGESDWSLVSSDGNTAEVKGVDLLDVETAKNYLTNTYSSYTWTRK